MIDSTRRRLIRTATLLPLLHCATMASRLESSETPSAPDQSTDNNTCHPLLRHRLRPLMSPQEQSLCEAHAGKVLLIVNTASKCGFTPQFKSLETLNQRYASSGFAVLGFPSDDFRQELGTEQEVAEFCELNYGVTFPMYQKIAVSAGGAHPLYQDLAAATGQFPGWNFNKYLIDRQGQAIAHYGSGVLPLGNRMISAIESLL